MISLLAADLVISSDARPREKGEPCRASCLPVSVPGKGPVTLPVAGCKGHFPTPAARKPAGYGESANHIVESANFLFADDPPRIPRDF